MTIMSLICERYKSIEEKKKVNCSWIGRKRIAVLHVDECTEEKMSVIEISLKTGFM